MGMDLRRGKDGLSVSVKTWIYANALAVEGGWEQLGTLPSKYLSEEDKNDWDGSYDGNVGEIIRDEDAKAMADGLAAMLARLPPPVADVTDGAGPVSRVLSPQNYFKTENKRKVLQALIEFLRGGECEIW